MAGGSQTFFSNLFFVWYIPKNQPTDPPKDPFVYLLGSWRLSHLDRELPTTAASSSCIQMHRFSFYSLIRFGSKTFFFFSFLLFLYFIYLFSLNHTLFRFLIIIRIFFFFFFQTIKPPSSIQPHLWGDWPTTLQTHPANLYIF